jgi:Flp pilus assembly protein TadD
MIDLRRLVREAALFLATSLDLMSFATASGAMAQQGPDSRSSAVTKAQSWFQKGQAALQSANLEGAEVAFRHVLSLDPDSAAAYVNLGVIAMRRKNWGLAVTILKKAEKLAPKMTGVRLNLG